MELITSWSDTGPTWLSGIGGIIAALIAGYALYRAVRAERRHVEWQLTNERKPDGRRSDIWRLVNTSSGVRAMVVGFENVSEGHRDAVREAMELPRVVEAGNWMPIVHARSMASPYPTIIRVDWREGPSQGRVRRRVYSSTLYID